MADKKKIIYADNLQKSIVDDVTIKGSAFAAIMRHLQDAPAVQEWISVKDRLPESGCVVLGYMISGDYRTLKWKNNTQRWEGLLLDYAKDFVTHWMPLPEPPKGE